MKPNPIQKSAKLTEEQIDKIMLQKQRDKLLAEISALKTGKKKQSSEKRSSRKITQTFRG